MDIKKVIEDSIRRRVGLIGRKLGHYWNGVGEFRCYIAGGCLLGNINDVDIFPVAGEPAIPEPKDAEAVSRTKNAATFACEPWPVQLCTYVRPSLQSLVDSFDFAHIQVGACVTIHQGFTTCGDVYFTDALVAARATASTWFCGSEYPLSSLIRAGKYYKRDAMPRGAFIRAVIDSIGEVVKRGFSDYEDFKDQLDAVDLGLLTEEMDEVEKASLMELFQRLERK